MEGAANIHGSLADRPLRDKPLVQQLEVLMARLDALPDLPQAAGVILQAATAEMPLAEALRADPAVAERLGELARHAAGGAGDGEALGLEGACRAVLCTKLPAAFDAAGGRLDRQAFWDHCIAVAVCAGMIAARAGRPALAAFAAGLLHDVGKIALDTCLPKSYGRVLQAVGDGRGDIARIEREIIGIDHTIAGRRLGQHWHLPGCVQEAIWLHHHPPEAVPRTLEGAALIAAVQAADAVVRRRNIGFSGNHVFEADDGQLARAVNVSVADISELSEQLPARLAAHGRLVAPAAVSDGAAAPARKAGPARRPARRPLAASIGPGEVLRLLGDFAVRVTPATPLTELCGEIARTFQEMAAVGDGVVCAFAISAASGRATLVMRSADGGQSCRLSGCRAPAPAPPGRRCPAGQTLRYLLKPPDAWSDLIDLNEASCLPLVSRGRWLGGILVPAGAALDEDLLHPALDVMSFVLAGASARAEGELLAERLAGASVRLAETREALAQAQALAAIGEMAAGAAHELNNPLAVISGRAQLLAGKAGGDSERRAARKIAQKAQEISDIATELLAFARPEPPRPQALAVDELLQRARKQALSEVKRKTPRLTVDIDMEPGCPKVWADAGQVETVLLELVRNAFLAGKAAGRKKLNVRIAAGSRGRADGVQIRVTDDGPGMDAETLAAAFTPFFSRRPAGRGRGMGLAQARRRLQANAGSIRIESQVEKGTTVFVELPSPGGGVDS